MSEEDEKNRPPSRTPAEGVRIIGAEEAQAAIDAGQVAGRVPDDAPRFGDVPEAPAGPRPSLRFPLPDTVEPDSVGTARAGDPSTTVRASDPPTTELPHWTEPPTGEVPRIRPEGEDDDYDDETWSAITSSSPRWRDQPSDWEEGDFDAAALHDEGEARLGALDNDRPAPSDLFDFDDGVPNEEREPMSISSRARPAAPAQNAAVAASGRELVQRIVTGVGIAAVFLLICWQGGRPWAAGVVTLVVTLASVELFNALRQRGYQPATLLGLVGTAAMVGAAYWKGEQAYPLILALMVIFTLLWYLAGVVRTLPATNAGVSLLGFAYVGFLGSFAALMLKFPDGIGMLIGAIVVTVGYDVGGYFIGNRFGRVALAPDISPNKTVEGLVGGWFTMLVLALLIVTRIHPWDVGSALALFAVVGIAAPLGDLSESLIKRDLGIKDMGSILPGHGGVLDRIDALLFVVPATYYLVRFLELR